MTKWKIMFEISYKIIWILLCFLKVTFLFLRYPYQYPYSSKKVSLAEMITRCYSLSLFVTRCHSFYHSLSFLLPLLVTPWITPRYFLTNELFIEIRGRSFLYWRLRFQMLMAWVEVKKLESFVSVHIYYRKSFQHSKKNR